MTILLVDDELQLRNYLRTLVDWEGEGYRFMEAENGAAAVEIMKREEINLLLLDITMPEMNGLEVLEWVRENYSDCVTAMLTSHDEFSYAQNALRLGCFDYILKSDITGEAILALADRMRKTLAEETQQQQRYAAIETAARRRETLEMQDAVNYWLKNSEDSTPEASGIIEQKLGFGGREGKYVLLRIQIYDYNTVVNRYTGSDVVQFSVVFDGVLRELLEGFDFFCTESDAGEFLVFLRFDPARPDSELSTQAEELTKRIDASFSGLLGIRSDIIRTEPYLRFEAGIARYLSLQKLRDRSFWGLSGGISRLEDYVFDEQICAKELGEFARIFEKELESRSVFRIEATYDDMAANISARRYCISPASFKNICVSCASVFLRGQKQDAAGLQALFTLGDSASFKNALLDIVRPTCISEKDMDKKTLAKKALLLIQQHYHQNIGLDWLAQRLYVNASYLSRVFSAETGQPVTAYINSYRIEEAKRLIRAENLKLYEVAEKTGFASSIVFSSVFKKITGETPSEYKSKNV